MSEAHIPRPHWPRDQRVNKDVCEPVFSARVLLTWPPLAVNGTDVVFCSSCEESTGVLGWFIEFDSSE